jgi:hypothetical protein
MEKLVMVFNLGHKAWSIVHEHLHLLIRQRLGGYIKTPVTPTAN